MLVLKTMSIIWGDFPIHRYQYEFSIIQGLSLQARADDSERCALVIVYAGRIMNKILFRLMYLILGLMR